MHHRDQQHRILDRTTEDYLLPRNLRVSRTPRGEMFSDSLLLSLEGESPIVLTAAQEEVIRKAVRKAGV